MSVLQHATPIVSRRYSIREFRWLVILFFVPLLLGQSLQVPGATDSTSLCGLGWIVGTSLLLWASNKPIRNSLWCWTIFFVFVMGFYVKYFAFAYGMGNPVFEILNPELVWADRTNLDDALVWSTIGFLTFAIASCALLRFRSLPVLAPNPYPESIKQKNLSWILALTFLGVIGSLVAALIFGFGQMGLEHHELPLHLDAIFTRFRISLAPAVFITALWVTDHKRTRTLWLASLFIMILCGVLDAYVRGSRGSILLTFLPPVFLWCLSGTYSRGRKSLTLGVVLLTIVLYPVMTGVRGERIANGQGVDFDQRAASQNATSSDELALSLDQAAGRIVGIDSMIEVRHHMRTLPGAEINFTTLNPSRMVWMASGAEMVTYMTYTVVGIPEDVVEGRSPGFLGGLYLVGGPDGMVLFTLLFVLAVAAIWNSTSKHPYAAPLLAYLTSVLLSYTEEGVYGLENPISTAIAVALVIWLFRKFVVKSQFKPHHILRLETQVPKGA